MITCKGRRIYLYLGIMMPLTSDRQRTSMGFEFGCRTVCAPAQRVQSRVHVHNVPFAKVYP